MNLRRGDGVLVVGGVLAAAGAVVAAVVGTRAGLVVLALGLAVALIGVARVASILLGGVDRLTRVAVETRKAAKVTQRVTTRSRPVLRTSMRQAKRAATVARRVELRARDQGRQQAEIRDLVQDVRHEQQTSWRRDEAHALRVRTTLDTMPSDTTRLTRLSERVAPGHTELPSLGGWALTAGTLLAMVDEVYSRPGPVTILECGSGSSTLFFALALAERGHGGRVVALETSESFGEQTRSHLRRHGVDELATVVDAPLVEQQVPAGTSHLWFDVAELPDIGPVDLLFVDGPVGASSSQARYPALPVLAPRLAPGALVVLDDSDRPDESQILERWLAEDHGVRLEVERIVSRSTFIRASS